jgi:hypothetical protein
MNKKQLIQFKTIKQIETFLAQRDSGTLDNLWENITDEYDVEVDANICVSEFNKSIKSLVKLVS